MPLLDKFALWGARAFSDHGWHRVSYQPVLYLFVWGAALRVAITSDTPIPFDVVFSPYVETAWVPLGLICPPLAFLAWWLMGHKCRLPRSALAGLWLRLAADAGQFAVLQIFFIVSFAVDPHSDESHVYSAYILASAMLFMLIVLVRDVWSLVMTEKLAGVIARSEKERNG